ncbi:MAG: MerR family transcriptional regulator [Pseudobutyrivibrio sp.]|nr:MerR family transcriptional regulator [Pseudobutyrivibrio sp.]
MTQDNFTIKQISALFDLPASTLRYYEELGLLEGVERTSSNQRIYHQNHVERLNAIQCFKDAGMSIQELVRFFQYEKDEAGSIDDILNLLQTRKELVETQLSNMKKSYKHLQKKIKFYSAIKEAKINNKPIPKWDDYK